jgi:hypothetical protein
VEDESGAPSVSATKRTTLEPNAKNRRNFTV